MGLKIAILLGCLTLSAARSLTLEKASISLTQEITVRDGAATNDLLRTILGYVTSGVNLRCDPGCSKGRCECCEHFLGACFVATLEKDSSIEINVTFKQKPVMDVSINVPHPKPFCKEKVPNLTWRDVCVTILEFNQKEASGCVVLSFTTASGWGVTDNIGCFKIPAVKTFNPALEQIESVKV